MAKNFLRFGVWNIEGLHRKLNDTDFLSKIDHFDFISLVETWIPYGIQMFTLMAIVHFLNVVKKNPLVREEIQAK